jgi:hypothetical protein
MNLGVEKIFTPRGKERSGGGVYSTQTYTLPTRLVDVETESSSPGLSSHANAENLSQKVQAHPNKTGFTPFKNY